MGQQPSSAYPICGKGTFRQLIVPYGSAGNMNLPGCGQVALLNPFYYSFTCYTSGTLAILIDPLDPAQDYNWELFDIYGQSPEEIFNNASLAVIGNWSGTPGKSGATANGNPSTICVSPGQLNKTTFSEMPNLIQGHQYLLLISGYSQIQSDYFLSFEGGTANISNPASPDLLSATVNCDKNRITVVTQKKMRCNSLTADGSNFILNNGTASVIGAEGLHCAEGFDFDTLNITLSNDLAPGNYSISTKINKDGNALFDDCFNDLPIGGFYSFTVFPGGTVSADFDFQIGYGCTIDTVLFRYPLANMHYPSAWYRNMIFTSSLQAPVMLKPVSQSLVVRHIVSNGTCSDTVSKSINPDPLFQAAFRTTAEICPNTPATFKDISTGKILSWNWDYGDGTLATGQEPPNHLYPESPHEKKYLVQLIVQNELGCYDSFSTSLIKLQSCSVAVPNAFTPNGDGKNDYLFPLNAFAVRDLEFKVYNRFGQQVFETREATDKWDGTRNGLLQPAGTYIWTLHYSEGSTGKNFTLRGTVVLVR